MIADVIGLSGTAVGNTVTITMLYEHFVCQTQFLLLPFFRPVYTRGKSATHSSEIARRLSKGGGVVADRHSSERASKKDRSLSICRNAARTVTTTFDDAIDRCGVPATDRTS